MNRLLLMVVFFGACTPHQKSFEGYKVYTVRPRNRRQADVFSNFTDNEHYDFWTPHQWRSERMVMVTPQMQNYFHDFLEHQRIPYTITIPNLERTLEKERVFQSLYKNDPINFRRYYRYSEILGYILRLSKAYTNITNIEYIGTSTEGRDLVALKVSTGGGKIKPAILIDGGIHAREWISPAVVLYIIQQLVGNPKNYYLLKKIDWYFIPHVNPDGYEYSHTVHRMWRKTRSKGYYCDGVDANRNFGFQWGGPGTSSDECKEDYKGPYPFSEPETRALRDYVFRHPPNYFKLYVTFHSFGKFILYPWGYKPEAVDNFWEHEYLGGKVRDAIRGFSGTTYTVETVSKTMGLGAGGSDDWMKGVGGADFSFCFELPGGGTNGFDLPPQEILPVARETFEGVKAFHAGIDELYNK